MANVYQRNFDRLEKLIPDLAEFIKKLGNHRKLKSGGFMDLSINVLSGNTISMAHNYTQNSDLVPDPDMELRVDLTNRTVEALTFQSSLAFQRVYVVKEGKTYVYPRIKRELNGFLEMWLKNLKTQGFYPVSKAGKGRKHF